MSAPGRVVLTSLIVALGAAGARAQGTPGGNTAVYLQAGAGSAEEGTGALAGGVVLQQVTRRLAVELSAAHLDRGPGISATPVGASLLFHVLPGERRLSPYVAAGAGLYRASFDLSHARFDPRGPAMGPMVIPGGAPNSGVIVWVDGVLPDFYSDRLAAALMPAEPLQGSRAFTDPALVLGGGIRLALATRGELRADARAVSVRRGGESDTLGVFTLQLGFRF